MDDLTGIPEDPQEAALAVRVICSIYESTRTGRPIVF